MKLRLDQLLIDQGLVSSREKGKALILAGQVLVNQQKIDKPGTLVPSDAQLTLLNQTKYVSRGGFKLEAAIRHFQIRCLEAIAVDIGTSTGGFTDCLLQHAAKRVHCVDVGATQIDWSLRNREDVILHENQNAREVTPEIIGEEADILVCDVSFISLTLLLDRFPPLLKPEGQMVILIKPQFEVGRGEVGKGGIVRDPALHKATIDRITQHVSNLGYQTQTIPSPILGTKGNREFLLHATPSANLIDPPR
jgi:23S rRNA (cytidine1920-2'-O)/16S rRNA (cytidine1409-2'-O)-methyltransferase